MCNKLQRALAISGEEPAPFCTQAAPDKNIHFKMFCSSIAGGQIAITSVGIPAGAVRGEGRFVMRWNNG